MMNNSLHVTHENQIWWQKEVTNRPPAGQVILYYTVPIIYSIVIMGRIDRPSNIRNMYDSVQVRRSS